MDIPITGVLAVKFKLIAYHIVILHHKYFSLFFNELYVIWIFDLYDQKLTQPEIRVINIGPFPQYK